MSLHGVFGWKTCVCPLYYNKIPIRVPQRSDETCETMLKMNDSTLDRPLFFEPVYKTAPWGGSKLTTVFNRRVSDLESPVGEAWEIVDRADAQSVVSDGPLAGRTLHELIAADPEFVLGAGARADARFPLIIKLIDTREHLSIQVHPGEKDLVLHPDAEPKTEMWYILHTVPGARIYAGFLPGRDRTELEKRLRDGELEGMLRQYEPAFGDLFYIEAGRIHSIGGGNLLFEVQQNSDTSYRLFDWKRVDRHGRARQLHIEQAMDCIRFDLETSPKIEKDRPFASRNRMYDLTGDRPGSPFAVQELKLVSECLASTHTADGTSRFNILTAVDCDAEIRVNGESFLLAQGSSCLIPACLGPYRIAAPEGRTATLLLTTAAH